MSSYLCDHCGQNAIQFCLCRPTPFPLCGGCVYGKHEDPQVHEIFPMTKLELLQEVQWNIPEFRRKVKLSESCHEFLNKLVGKEAAAQGSASSMINELVQSYQRWLDNNHKCFEALVSDWREEIDRSLVNSDYRVSSISKLLIEKWETLDSLDDARFFPIPEWDTLEKLNKSCKRACSRTQRVWSREYEEEILNSLTGTTSTPMTEPEVPVTITPVRHSVSLTLTPTPMQAEVPISPNPIPDFSTPITRAALSKSGVYSFPDTEESLVRKPPVIEGDGVYVGQWNTKGEKHGFGIRIWTDGTQYEGQWQQGKQHGRGRVICVNGDVIEGDWIQNRLQGHGMYQSQGGDVYSGEFTNGKFNGKGWYKYRSNDEYIGGYQEGVKEGRGVLFGVDGSIYAGNYSHDKKHGKGVLVSATGEIYFGDFADGAKSGQGRFYYSNGASYSGSWVNNVSSGFGKMTYPGDAFEVGFVDGKMHGEGRVTVADGKVYKCQFSQGRRTI